MEKRGWFRLGVVCGLVAAVGACETESEEVGACSRGITGSDVEFPRGFDDSGAATLSVRQHPSFD